MFAVLSVHGCLVSKINFLDSIFLSLLILNFQFLHISEHAIVVNKPSGLLSVPGRLPENKDCLETRVQQEYSDALTVHRLDQVTSGIVLYARGKDVQRFWNRQFQQRAVDKTYIAMVEGLVADDTGSVELPLRCDWENRPVQIVDFEQGKSALTHWRVLERDMERKRTRMKLTPVTGRSHQLRVHMQQIGHPIVGDTMYGAQSNEEAENRVFLHAAAISIPHPRLALLEESNSASKKNAHTELPVERLEMHCPPDF